MAKYEIMLIVSGSLDEKKSKDVANEIATTIKTCKPEIEEYGLKELAYKIGKDTHGYYYQYNFECEDPNQINEFRRLATINKNVLRQLIINLEKDYGYRATINPKKIKNNQIKAEIHAKRKAEYEKIKEARQSANVDKKDDDNLEHLENQSDVKTKKTVAKKETGESKAKKTKESSIDANQKHTIVSMAEFSDYNYDRRRKEWHEKAGHNEKQVVCSICKDDDNWESIKLENGDHICYYCWIKKPANLKSEQKATTTKKTVAKKETNAAAKKTATTKSTTKKTTK